MKKIKTAFKKYIGELLLIIGSFVTTYSVFGWLGASRSYFKEGFLLWIAIGITSIVIGILIIRNKSKNK